MNRSQTTHYELVCTETGERFKPDEVRYLSPRAVGLQERGRALRGVLEVDYDYEVLQQRFNRVSLAETRTRGLRRYFPLLPLSSESYLSPLLIGDTPLYEGGRLGAYLGMSSLHLKDESRNPAGSLKDRASALVRK